MKVLDTMIEHYKSDNSTTYDLFIALYHFRIATYDQIDDLLDKRYDVDLRICL